MNVRHVLLISPAKRVAYTLLLRLFLLHKSLGVVVNLFTVHVLCSLVGKKTGGIVSCVALVLHNFGVISN